MTISMQGYLGSFHHQAGMEFVELQNVEPNVEWLERSTFDEVADDVLSGKADYGVMATWNKIVGPISASVRVLVQMGERLKVIDEVDVKVEQHLIGLRNTNLKQVVEVFSHPAALAQCANFFTQHPWMKAIETDDTAGSVKMVLAANDPTRAAIAGSLAASTYAGAILAPAIQDQKDNFTHFLLIKKRELS